MIEKHNKECSGHDAIVVHLKEMHKNELEVLNSKFANQLQVQTALLEREYICCLIYHTMLKLDRCWRTATKMRKGLASILYVKDHELAVKDNILMCYLGMGCNNCHTM